MSVRKKVKIATKTSNKKHMLLTSTEQEQNFSILFLLLPNEILEKIFKLLSPDSIVTIRKLGIQRLTDITYFFQKGDFSLCNGFKMEDLPVFFSPESNSNITELRFTDLFLVNPTSLRQCIMRCKNLRVLCVVNCGITLQCLTQLSKHCTQLEELYWTVNLKGSSSEEHLYKMHIFPNLHKLYLFSHIVWDSMPNVLNVVKMFPNVTNIRLNFSGVFCEVGPPSIPLNATVSERIKFDPVPCQTNVIIRSKFPFGYSIIHNCHILQYIIEEGKLSGRFMSYWSGPFLQFSTSDTDLLEDNARISKILPGIPNGSIRKLLVFLTPTYQVLEDHMEELKRKASEKLEHLTYSGIVGPMGDGTFVVDKLKELILNSRNISELNLVGVHLNITFPLSILCYLKNLKYLGLLPCSLVHCETLGGQDEEFEKFTLSCEKVRHLTMQSCLTCKNEPSDSCLSHVRNWKNLDSLVLTGAPNVFKYNFMSKLWMGNDRFKSVVINNLSNSSYIPHIRILASYATNLTFLRINQKSFYLESTFWTWIARAKKLQGLCISSDTKNFIDNRAIVSCIKELPVLHLFHLGVSRHCENLEDLVGRAMKQNHIKNFDVRIYSPMHCDGCLYMHFGTEV